MTPEQKLKHMVVLANFRLAGMEAPDEPITADNIDELYDKLEEDGGQGWGLQDARQEVRGGEVETEVTAPYSRHYEAKSVAAKTPDGSWVGWTYWYGGGKHGEPEAIDWMDEAYDLDCTEEEKMVVVRTFAKRPPPPTKEN